MAGIQAVISSNESEHTQNVPGQPDAADAQKEGRRHDACASAASKKTPRRLWAKHKAEAVVRLLAGGDIDLLAREYGVPVSTLSDWRNAFIQAGEDALKGNRKEGHKDIEIKRVKEKSGT